MDPVKDFFADLKSPDPSIRFSVLSRIEDLAWDDQQQAELKNLISQETDPGIRFHMQKVLARLDKSEKNRAGVEEIEQLLNQSDRDEIALALLLESVKRSDSLLIADSLRKSNWSSFSSQLLPSVLKFFKKYGSYEDAAGIEILCRHHDPRVLSAAIEALEKIAPDRLKDLIVPLLVNPNFGIRSRAVRLLHRWDPNEALRHFESMLFSQIDSEKQAALFHAFFFPFTQIESLLLRFISIEKDSELIKRAGLLFMANPHGQSPARLLEVRQSCTGEKFKLIDQILKGVLSSLFQARIVKATPEQMLEVLEAHFRQKRLKLFIDRYGIGLKSEDSDTRYKSALKLCDMVRYNFAEAKTVLDAYLKVEPLSEIRQKVADYLASCQPASKTEATTRSKDSEIRKEIAPENHDFNSINEENFERVITVAAANFKDMTIRDQISLIKAIEQFGNKSHTDLPARILKSETPELLATAIDCLSKIDPDILLPYLPQLIKHSSDDVRESSIKVFALFDKQQAIALIEKMLFSLQPMQRKHAILCCGHFDFQSVAHLVLKALKIEGDPENQQQLSSLLRSNAEEELFYKLYADFKTCNTSKKQLYEEICSAMANLLSSGENPISKQKLYEKAIQQLEEEEKCQKQRQAYKLEKIQEIRRDTEKKLVVDAGLARFTLAAYGIGALLTALIWFLFLAPPSSSSPAKITRPPSTRSSQTQRTATIKGIITKTDRLKRLLELKNSADGKKYRIRVDKDYGELPNEKSEYTAQIEIVSETGELIEADLLTSF